MSIFKILTVGVVIVAILLIGCILLQEPKERLVHSGGSAASIQRIGINQKADFLEKATWVLVGLLLSLTFLSSIFLKDIPQSSVLMQHNLAKTPEEPTSNSKNDQIPNTDEANVSADQEATTAGSSSDK
ncbi:preprotein translocase subunit SecG [Candidatus Cardinium hertigii]|jgi:protein translocase SecG subunit|uniref:Protein-export membrane protein SecG n=1 Tax=Candidatus Cardinium hertigii TaxID=247481 RepID=A0A3N2QBD0_9BACT|nr:preprotein translocase subunit SecG [Candidatus Cardinium hertigii]ROT47126.1 preprotein translocase subunit SecG [Candidatus Cardinium hertigii]